MVISQSDPMPHFTKKAVTFHTEILSIFTVVQKVQNEFQKLNVISQRHLNVILNSILLVGLVQATTTSYYFVFQLKITDCVTNQKVQFQINGGNGLLM